MERAQALALAREERDYHADLGYPQLYDWTFEVSTRAKRRLAATKYDKQTISLSAWLLDNHDEERILLTVRHELAHAILGPGYGHGDRWRELCLRIGGDGKRLVREDLEGQPEYRYHAVCEECGVVGGLHRLHRTRRTRWQTHRNCGARVRWIDTREATA